MAQEDEKEVKEQEEEAGEEEIQEPPQMGLPPVTFENFVFGMYNTALINLGFRDPETGKVIRNLPMARHTIDTLVMIQEKTKGNLTAPESNFLENMLYELRMSYLRAEKQAAEEPAEEVKDEAAESPKDPEAQETTDEDS